MSLIRIGAALVLAGAASLACAQGAASPASPAKKELVAKVLQLQAPAMENLGRALAEQLLGPLGQQTGAALQQRIPPEQREAVAKELQAEFVKYGDEVAPLLRDKARQFAPSTVGAMLEERLSEDELKQLVAMLEAPIYRKYNQMAPEFQRALVEKVASESRSVVEPKVMALQAAVAKRLGIAPAPADTAAKPAPAAKPAASAAAKKP